MNWLFQKILPEKLWTSNTVQEKIVLSQLFLIWGIAGLGSVFLLLFNFIFTRTDFSIISNVVLIAMNAAALGCTLNGKVKCSINMVFVVPLVLYSYYISDFSQHPPFINTIYYTTSWLIAGLLILFFYSETNSKIWFYFLISVITIGFHLFKAGHLWDSTSYFEPVILNPLIIFSGIFAALYLLRRNLRNTIRDHEEKLIATQQGISKVFQESTFSIAQLRAERDEAGNLIQLYVDRVNNTFESVFKINLYEVQDQKADYIFNLIFKNKFDLNKIILTKTKKTREFYSVSMERWFNIHVLQPDYNRFFILFEDTTKVKLTMAELEENKRRYKVLLDAIPDIFFVIDKDGTYEDFVIKESDLFKIEDANVIGSTIFDVGFPDNMASKIYSCIQDAIKNNSIETIEYQMNTPNGTFLFEMRLARLNSNSVISIARNITKRKTAEFKLEKALVKAEESDRLKSAFLTNLSHEIRTPLNIITNFTRILTESELEQDQKHEFSDAILQNSKQLMNMIDNTIHLSKIETQTVVVEHKFCKVNSVLRDVYNKYLVIIPDSKNIKLSLKIGVPNNEFGFETDPVILREIISLLVDNSVKYTLKGEIVIEYEMIRNEWVEFSVSDTGIGIPEEEFVHIFDRFYRIKNSINETTSGSGNGLAIVQHYVALLGGELEFESKVNVGSKFWFAIPFSSGKGFLSVVK